MFKSWRKMAKKVMAPYMYTLFYVKCHFQCISHKYSYAQRNNEMVHFIDYSIYFKYFIHNCTFVGAFLE